MYQNLGNKVVVCTLVRFLGIKMPTTKNILDLLILIKINYLLSGSFCQLWGLVRNESSSTLSHLGDNGLVDGHVVQKIISLLGVGN